MAENISGIEDFFTIIDILNNQTKSMQKDLKLLDKKIADYQNNVKYYDTETTKDKLIAQFAYSTKTGSKSFLVDYGNADATKNVMLQAMNVRYDKGDKKGQLVDSSINLRNMFGLKMTQMSEDITAADQSFNVAFSNLYNATQNRMFKLLPDIFKNTMRGITDGQNAFLAAYNGAFDVEAVLKSTLLFDRYNATRYSTTLAKQIAINTTDAFATLVKTGLTNLYESTSLKNIQTTKSAGVLSLQSLADLTGIKVKRAHAADSDVETLRGLMQDPKAISIIKEFDRRVGAAWKQGKTSDSELARTERNSDGELVFRKAYRDFVKSAYQQVLVEQQTGNFDVLSASKTEWEKIFAQAKTNWKNPPIPPQNNGPRRFRLAQEIEKALSAKFSESFSGQKSVASILQKAGLEKTTAANIAATAEGGYQGKAGSYRDDSVAGQVAQLQDLVESHGDTLAWSVKGNTVTFSVVPKTPTENTPEGGYKFAINLADSSTGVVANTTEGLMAYSPVILGKTRNGIKGRTLAEQQMANVFHTLQNAYESDSGLTSLKAGSLNFRARQVWEDLPTTPSFLKEEDIDGITVGQKSAVQNTVGAGLLQIRNLARYYHDKLGIHTIKSKNGEPTVLKYYDEAISEFERGEYDRDFNFAFQSILLGVSDLLQESAPDNATIQALLKDTEGFVKDVEDLRSKGLVTDISGIKPQSFLKGLATIGSANLITAGTTFHNPSDRSPTQVLNYIRRAVQQISNGTNGTLNETYRTNLFGRKSGLDLNVGYKRAEFENFLGAKMTEARLQEIIAADKQAVGQNELSLGDLSGISLDDAILIKESVAAKLTGYRAASREIQDQQAQSEFFDFLKQISSGNKALIEDLKTRYEKGESIDQDLKSLSLTINSQNKALASQYGLVEGDIVTGLSGFDGALTLKFDQLTKVVTGTKIGGLTGERLTARVISDKIWDRTFGKDLEFVTQGAPISSKKVTAAFMGRINDVVTRYMQSAEKTGKNLNDEAVFNQVLTDIDEAFGKAGGPLREIFKFDAVNKMFMDVSKYDPSTGNFISRDTGKILFQSDSKHNITASDRFKAMMESLDVFEKQLLGNEAKTMEEQYNAGMWRYSQGLNILDDAQYFTPVGGGNQEEIANYAKVRFDDKVRSAIRRNDEMAQKALLAATSKTAQQYENYKNSRVQAASGSTHTDRSAKRQITDIQKAIRSATGNDANDKPPIGGKDNPVWEIVEGKSDFDNFQIGTDDLLVDYDLTQNGTISKAQYEKTLEGAIKTASAALKEKGVDAKELPKFVRIGHGYQFKFDRSIRGKMTPYSEPQYFNSANGLVIPLSMAGSGLYSGEDLNYYRSGEVNSLAKGVLKALKSNPDDLESLTAATKNALEKELKFLSKDSTLYDKAAHSYIGNSKYTRVVGNSNAMANSEGIQIVKMAKQDLEGMIKPIDSNNADYLQQMARVYMSATDPANIDSGVKQLLSKNNNLTKEALDTEEAKKNTATTLTNAIVNGVMNGYTTIYADLLRWPVINGNDMQKAIVQIGEGLAGDTIETSNALAFMMKMDYDGDKPLLMLSQFQRRTKSLAQEKDFVALDKENAKLSTKAADRAAEIIREREIADKEEAKKKGKSIDDDYAKVMEKLSKEVTDAKRGQFTGLYSKHMFNKVGQFSNINTAARNFMTELGWDSSEASKEEQLYAAISRSFFELFEQDAISSKKVFQRLAANNVNNTNFNINELDKLYKAVVEGDVDRFMKVAEDMQLLSDKDNSAFNYSDQLIKNIARLEAYDLLPKDVLGNDIKMANGKFSISKNLVKKALKTTIDSINKLAPQYGNRTVWQRAIWNQLSTADMQAMTSNFKATRSGGALGISTSKKGGGSGGDPGGGSGGNSVYINLQDLEEYIAEEVASFNETTHQYTGESGNITKKGTSNTSLAKESVNIVAVDKDGNPINQDGKPFYSFGTGNNSSSKGTYFHKLMEIMGKNELASTAEITQGINDYEKLQTLGYELNNKETTDLKQRADEVQKIMNKDRALYRAKQNGIFAQAQELQMMGHFTSNGAYNGGTIDDLMLSFDTVTKKWEVLQTDYKHTTQINDPATIAERIYQLNSNMALFAKSLEHEYDKYWGSQQNLNQTFSKDSIIGRLFGVKDENGNYIGKQLKSIDGRYKLNKGDIKTLYEGLLSANPNESKVTALNRIFAIDPKSEKLIAQEFGALSGKIQIGLWWKTQHTKAIAEKLGISNSGQGLTTEEKQAMIDSAPESIRSKQHADFGAQKQFLEKEQEYFKYQSEIDEINRQRIALYDSDMNLPVKNQEKLVKLNAKKAAAEASRNALIPTLNALAEDAGVGIIGDKPGNLVFVASGGLDAETSKYQDLINQQQDEYLKNNDNAQKFQTEFQAQSTKSLITAKDLYMELLRTTNDLEKTKGLMYGIKDTNSPMYKMYEAEVNMLQNRANTLQSGIQQNLGYMLETDKETLQNYMVGNAKQNQETTMRTAQINQIQNGSLLGGFASSFKQTIHYILNRTLAYGLIGVFKKAFATIIQSATQLNAAMVNLQIASGQTTEQTREMVGEYTKLAKEMGRTTTELAVASNDWLRAGYRGKEVAELTKASMQLSTLGMIEAKDATTYLISTLKGWKSSVNDVSRVVDKLTTIDMMAAISAGELANAMSYANNAARLAGVSQDNYIGMIATVKDTTQKSAETVGTAFKTIFSRFGNIKAGKFVASAEEMSSEGYNEEEFTKLNDIETVLGTTGIKLRSSPTKWRDLDDVMEEIGQKWDTWDQTTRNAVATAIAGTRQREVVVSLFENWEEVGRFAQAAEDSYGTAAEKMKIYSDSIEAAKKRMSVAYEEIALNIEKSGIITTFYDTIGSLIKVFGNLKTALIAIVAVLGLNGTGVTKALGAILPRLGYLSSTTMSQRGIALGWRSGVQNIKEGLQAGILAKQQKIYGLALAKATATLNKDQQAAYQVTQQRLLSLTSFQKQQVQEIANANYLTLENVQHRLKLVNMSAEEYARNALTQADYDQVKALSQNTAKFNEQYSHLTQLNEEQRLLYLAYQKVRSEIQAGNPGYTAIYGNGKGKIGTLQQSSESQTTPGMFALTGFGNMLSMTAGGAAGAALTKTWGLEEYQGIGMMAGSSIAMLVGQLFGPGGMVASIVVGGFLAIFNTVKQKEKERQQKLFEEAKEQYNQVKDMNTVASKISKLTYGLDELGNNVSLTDEEYQDFLTYSNQLAEAFPELVMRIDDSGNSIINFQDRIDEATGSVQTLSEAIDNQVTAAQQKADRSLWLDENIKGLFEEAQKVETASRENFDKYQKSGGFLEVMDLVINKKFTAKDIAEIASNMFVDREFGANDLNDYMWTKKDLQRLFYDYATYKAYGQKAVFASYSLNDNGSDSDTLLDQINSFTYWDKDLFNATLNDAKEIFGEFWSSSKALSTYFDDYSFVAADSLGQTAQNITNFTEGLHTTFIEELRAFARNQGLFNDLTDSERAIVENALLRVPMLGANGETLKLNSYRASLGATGREVRSLLKNSTIAKLLAQREEASTVGEEYKIVTELKKALSSSGSTVQQAFGLQNGKMASSIGDQIFSVVGDNIDTEFKTFISGLSIDLGKQIYKYINQGIITGTSSQDVGVAQSLLKVDRLNSNNYYAARELVSLYRNNFAGTAYDAFGKIFTNDEIWDFITNTSVRTREEIAKTYSYLPESIREAMYQAAQEVDNGLISAEAGGKKIAEAIKTGFNGAIVGYYEQFTSKFFADMDTNGNKLIDTWEEFGKVVDKITGSLDKFKEAQSEIIEKGSLSFKTIMGLIEDDVEYLKYISFDAKSGTAIFKANDEGDTVEKVQMQHALDTIDMFLHKAQEAKASAEAQQTAAEETAAMLGDVTAAESSSEIDYITDLTEAVNNLTDAYEEADEARIAFWTGKVEEAEQRKKEDLQKSAIERQNKEYDEIVRQVIKDFEVENDGATLTYYEAYKKAVEEGKIKDYRNWLGSDDADIFDYMKKYGVTYGEALLAVRHGGAEQSNLNTGNAQTSTTTSTATLGEDAAEGSRENLEKDIMAKATEKGYSNAEQEAIAAAIRDQEVTIGALEVFKEMISSMTPDEFLEYIGVVTKLSDLERVENELDMLNQETEQARAYAHGKTPFEKANISESYFNQRRSLLSEEYALLMAQADAYEKTDPAKSLELRKKALEVERDIKNVDDEQAQYWIDLYGTVSDISEKQLEYLKERISTADTLEEELKYLHEYNEGLKKMLDLQKSINEHRKDTLNYQMEYLTGDPQSRAYKTVYAAQLEAAQEAVDLAEEDAYLFYQTKYEELRTLGYEATEAAKIASEDPEYLKKLSEINAARKNLGTTIYNDFQNQSKLIDKTISNLQNARPKQWGAIVTGDRQTINQINDYYGQIIAQHEAMAAESYQKLIESYDELTDEEVSAIKDKYNDAMVKIREAQISRLQDIKTYQESIYSALTKEVERYKEQITEQKEQTDKAYDDEIKKLTDKNTSIERTNKLLELQQNLLNAQNEKERVYREGIGWVMESPRSKIKEAQEALDDFYRQDQIDDLNNAKAEEDRILDERISNWNDYLEMLKTKYEDFNRLQEEHLLQEWAGVNSERELQEFLRDDMANFINYQQENLDKFNENQIEAFVTFNSSWDGFLSNYSSNLQRLAQLNSQAASLMGASNERGGNFYNYVQQDTQSISGKSNPFKDRNGLLNYHALAKEAYDNKDYAQMYLYLNERAAKMENDPRYKNEKSNDELLQEWFGSDNDYSMSEYVMQKAMDAVSRSDLPWNIDTEKKFMKTLYEKAGKDIWDYAYKSSNNVLDQLAEQYFFSWDNQEKFEEEMDKIFAQAEQSYAGGILNGPVTYTGLSMLHGSPSSPEYVLNSDQAYTLLRNFSTLAPSDYTRVGDNKDNGPQYILQGDIVLENCNDPAKFWDDVTRAMNNRYSVTKNR